ncbi:hypothetical protein [Clostridium aciditolerans]|uniref:Uncharacterized protein n=1 Tax=Clostridium aciditolerans TaxID=339861 RepID=A0A934M3V4_9CLOT|nr:hypothetical protein [Clostridium aciditolerans]MBI6873435.1 hypothetical protein [Clostridium aciditolerans]
MREFLKIIKPEYIISIMTLLLGIITVYYSNKNTSNNRVGEFISKNRIEWMQSLKAYISEYVSLVRYLIDECPPNVEGDYINKLTTLSCRIELHLNFKGKADNELIAAIKNVEQCWIGKLSGDDNDDIREATIGTLILLTQIYLKTEWERVKVEIEFGPKHKFDFDREYEKLKNTVNSKIESYKIEMSKYIKPD